MTMEHKESEKPKTEIPHDLQGYGIETCLPDHQRLDEHGKLQRFLIWEQEMLRNNPQVTTNSQEDSGKEHEVNESVKKAIGDIIPQNS